LTNQFPQFQVNADNAAELQDWDHDEYDETTGQGRCTTNEAAVKGKENLIVIRDWSVVDVK